jgi:hypothetical protein
MTAPTSTPPAHQFRQKPAPPLLPALEPLWEEVKTRRAEAIPYTHDVAARRALMGILSLLGQPVVLPQVALPPELSPYQADKIRRRLEPAVPSYDELLDLAAAAIKGAGKLSKTIDGQVRRSLAGILSMFVMASKSREVEAAAKINARAAQAQADADARERAAYAESQKAKVRAVQLAKLNSEELEYQKFASSLAQ